MDKPATDLLGFHLIAREARKIIDQQSKCVAFRPGQILEPINE